MSSYNYTAIQIKAYKLKKSIKECASVNKIQKKKTLVESKNKKKNNNNSSILHKHKEKMDLFQNKDLRISEIDSLIKKQEDQIIALRRKINIEKINNININANINTSVEISNIKTIIDDLHIKRENIINDKDETDYVLSTARILDDYIKIEEAHSNLEEKLKNGVHTDNGEIMTVEQELYKLNIDKNLLIDNYYSIVDPNYTNFKFKNTLSNLCANCNEPVEDIDEESYVCSNCGACDSGTYITRELSYKQQQEQDYRPQFKYEKESHLIDHLKRFSARENKTIPPEVIDAVLAESKKNRVTNLNDLTESKVKVFLKNRKLNDYYDNVISIINRINKRPPFILTSEIENKIKIMFQQIQVPFEKYRPPSRKNMISYNYLLFQFFLILGLPEFSKYFILLKSQEKLRQQDILFKKIVDDLAESDKSINWVFHATV
jgi:hypothetical protein